MATYFVGFKKKPVKKRNELVKMKKYSWSRIPELHSYFLVSVSSLYFTRRKGSFLHRRMSVYAIAREFLSLLRREDEKRYSVSNWTFGLMKLSGALLFTACVLSTAKQFFGDPIYCDTNEVHVDTNLFEHYCWIQGSFVAPHRYVKDTQLRHHHREEERIYQNYYQWIPFILFFQGLFCYLPYYYWKSSENGKVAKFMKYLDGGNVNDFDDPDLVNVESLAKCLFRKFGSHKGYAIRYMLSLFLCLLSLIIQLYLMDLMMGGNFFTLGTQLLSLQTDDDFKDFDRNPLLRVFPRMIRCWFEGKIGMSGTPERHAALCILPVNVFNEKIFTFIWFWYIFVLVFAAVDTFLGLIVISCSLPRILIFREVAASSNFSFETTDFGDWFILRQLQKNMDAATFKYLIEELSNQLASTAPVGGIGRKSFQQFPMSTPPRNHLNREQFV